MFCGTFTAGGLEVEVAAGKLRIVTEGKTRKFIDSVEQITFNGHDAALRRQQVLFVTERAVFQLTADGLELIEIAPGVDLDRDILQHMGFAPIMNNVRPMDAGLFETVWGKLPDAIAANRND
ncbi:hypothetical protein [Janthinobacterium sp. HLX7-2]|uniref:hypothetical protein n=1 Tax=Janthinobacterium sp. HLX7-2 TaxID=1259331 RepID=UPI003F212C7F